MNDYEIGLEDRQTKKRWAGENYGWQSPASFNKLYVGGKLNPVQQQIDRVTSTAKTAIEQTPYISGLLKFAGGVAKTVYQTLPRPAQQGIQFGLEKSQEAAENIAAATGLPVSVTDPTVIAELGMAAPGAIKGATQIAKTVGKDLLTPPPPSAPAMALAGSGGTIKLQQAAPDLAEMSAQPLQVISNLQPAQWDKPVKTLLQEGGTEKQIAKALETPYNAELAAKYKKITPAKLAKNEDGLLDTMLKRAEDIRQAFVAGNQRKAYDLASKNVFEAAADIYNATGKKRDLLRNEVRSLFGVREWHHIFGNKEAGEFMLSTVVQDPIIAINLFQHMKKLGLSSSGIAENIALMQKAGHNSWHRFMEDFGVEPRVKMRSGQTLQKLEERGLLGQQQGVGPKYTAPLDVAEFGKEISTAIQQGTTSVNELFTFIETYAKFNKWLRTQMKTGSFQPKKKPAPVSFEAQLMVDK